MSAKKPGWDGSTKISEASTGTEAGSTLAWVEQSRLKEFNDQLESSLKLVGLSRRNPKRSKSMTQKRKGLHERHATAPLSPIETGVLDELQSLLATAAAHPPDSERVASLDDATTATAPTPPPPPTATGFDPAKTPHAGRVVMPAAKPGAKILRGSVVGDLRATLEETRSLLSDRDEQLRKSRLREAELMTALERERQCVSRAERRIESLERALGSCGSSGRVSSSSERPHGERRIGSECTDP